MSAERYREELDRAVSFSGHSHEFFARAKALELIRLADKHLGDPAALDALDAGCGIGLTDRHLSGVFRSLSGTDVSAEALEVATRENRGVRYELADPQGFPFDEATFDLVFAANVVQVVATDERPRFASELARVTRSGGLVVIFEHNPYNPLTRLVVRRFYAEDSLQMLSASDSRRLLRDAGLTPVDLGYILLFPTLRRRLLAVARALRRLPLGAQYYLAARR